MLGQRADRGHSFTSIFYLTALWGLIAALFATHLRPGALFWDEWLYLQEIQAANSYLDWIFQPTSGHVFVSAKSLVALLYHFFGTYFLPYKIASLLLHCLIAKAFFDLVRRESSDRWAFLMAAFLSLSVAYEEVIAWSAHYREQFFALFFLLWNKEAFSLFREAKPVSLRQSLLVLAYLCLMATSFGNIVFGGVFIAIFTAIFRADLLRSKLMWTHVVALLLLGALYFGSYRGELSQQTAAQSVDLLSFSVERIYSAVGRLGEFLWRGVILPLFAANSHGLMALAQLMGLVAFFVFACCHLFKAELAKLVWFVTALILICFSTVWYRPDLKFVLEWNKYAFHPAVFLVAALALMAAASRWWIQVTLAAIVTLATFNGVFSAKRRSYDALIRHPGVLEMLSDFSQSFGALEGQKIALAEMKFRWPIFIQGSEPSLSLLFKAEPRLRSSEADFIEFNPSTSSARMSQFSNLLASSPAIRGFYAKYGGSLVLGAEGDGGTVTLSAGQVFVQEVSDPKDLGAYLKALELVIGYGDEARAGELELTIYDNQFSRLLSQTYSIASFTNNTPKRLDLSQPVYAIGGLFISIRLRGAGNSQQIAVYLAKNKSSQRGRFWDCRETPIASPWDNSSCVMSQSQIGVGVWRSDLPLS